MHRTIRSLAILVAGLLLSAAPALAAEPPADVVFDGTVTVTFTDPNAGALAGADVTLVARRPDLGDDAVVQVLAGTTDADGQFVFTGVARPAADAPPVTLDADALLERPNECGGSVRFIGEATATAAIEVSIPIEAGQATSSCRAFPVRGSVLDADGDPFAVASAVATVTYPDGEEERPDVSVDPDGSFAFIVRGWLGDGAASAELTVTGETTTMDGPEGCELLVALVATERWDLASSTEAPEPRALVAEPMVLSEACGSQGTPGPTGAPARPTITLPPTDAVSTPDGRRAGDGLAAGLFLLLVISLFATVAAERRLSRRGS